MYLRTHVLEKAKEAKGLAPKFRIPPFSSSRVLEFLGSWFLESALPPGSDGASPYHSSTMTIGT
jgi:hypothetical protein